MKFLSGQALIALSLIFLTSCNPLSATYLSKDWYPGVALSNAISVLSVSAPQVVAGESITLTLQLKDNTGKAFISSLPSIEFFVSGGTSSGELGEVVDNGDGSYTASFKGITAGTPTTFHATINGTEVSTELPTIEVMVGPFSLANSVVTLSDSQVISGFTVTATLTTVDSYGNALATGGLTVAFSNSGGNSTGSFGAVTDNNNGTYSVTFTGTGAGTATEILATINGSALTSTNPSLTVRAGLAASIVISANNNQTGLVGSSLALPFEVVVYDISNNPLTGETVDWVVTTGAGSLSSASNFTDALGLSSSTLTLGTLIGGNSVTATVRGTVYAVTFNATALHGLPSQLVFSTQPNGGVAGTVWTSQPVIEIRDSYGNLVTSGADSTSTIAVALSTGTGTLSGTLSIAAVAGVANFSANALSINLTGTNKMLTASATTSVGLVSGTSATFTITHGPATQLVFNTQPGGGVTGSAWTTQPVVWVEDALGNLVSTGADATRTISVALTTGNGVLSGTATKIAAGGSADFAANGLNINLIGTDKVLTASTTITAGAVTVASNAFTISLGAIFTGDWPFTALTDSSYNCTTGAGAAFTGAAGLNNCNQDLTGGVVELTPASQTDNSSTLFGNGTFSGTAYDSTYGLRLGNAGGCNGSSANCPYQSAAEIYELSSSWTPQWANLVSYWKFDGDVLDSKGTNHGTLNGAAAQSSTSKLGSGSVNLPVAAGAVDYVSVPDAASLRFTGAASITLMGWVKPTGVSGRQNIFTKGRTTAASSGGLGNYTLQQNALKFEFYYVDSVGSYHTYQTGNILTAGSWYHVALTFTFGTGTSMQIYLNGVPVTGSWTTGNGNGLGSSAITDPLWMGCIWGGECTRGNLDEMAIWNVALSGAEVSQIYARQTVAKTGVFNSRVMDSMSTGLNWTNFTWIPSLPFMKALPDAGSSESQTSYSSLYSGTLMTGIVGLWHLDEVAGTSGAGSVKDKSGLAIPNNGTPTGTISWGQDGKLGTAASFSGAAPAINLGHASTIAVNGPFTVSLWFNSSSPNFQKLFGSTYINATIPGFDFIVNYGTTLQFGLFPGGATAGTTVTYSPGPANYYVGVWHHAVASYDGTNMKIYSDGKLGATNSGAGGVSFASTYDVHIADQTGWAPFLGAIDEVGMWNRALDPAEVTQLYRRGANRIKYQVRSCSDSSCTTGSPPWLGPDGTNQSFFSETYNRASNSLTGAVSNGLPTMSFSNFGSLTVASNRYFQYRAILESDDTQTQCNYGSGAAACSPELQSVSAGPAHYDSSIPTVSNATGESYHYLTGFTQTLGASCAGGVRYLLSPDNSTWYYYNVGGSTWTAAASTTGSAGYALANPSSDLSSAVMNNFAAQANTGSIYFRAFLKSDGLNPCEISDISIPGNR